MPTTVTDKTNFRGGISVGDPGVLAAAKTATYTMKASDGMILVDASGGSFTVTLPAAGADPDGIEAIIKCSANPGANTCTVAAAGADTIDGAATSTLLTGAAKKCLSLQSDGKSKWFITGIF